MSDTNKKLGLALSGGGFRATLYHLGLVRFLRDAGVLGQVSHITSVSGGSIFAAHLALNWGRYAGSPSEFEAAAAEILDFVQMDVRNRITRRFPLAMPLRMARRLLGWSKHSLTLAGLLEYHYREYLYGDTSLFQLPESPQLHILATNLSEGCLCSFNRNGLLMVRRTAPHVFRLDRVEMGLATVPMAVAASSAFPGFFPPLVLTGAEVGASAGEFGRQAYTDGGVFDNLGVRMFRCLERRLLAESPLGPDDLLDLPAVAKALHEANSSPAGSPIRRLAQLLAAFRRGAPELSTGITAAKHSRRPARLADDDEALLGGLWDLMCQHRLQDDPAFAGVPLGNVDAEVLRMHGGPGGRALEGADQCWLNRQLLEAVLAEATGKRCFRRLNSLLDAVVVSDVGMRIEVQADRRAGGLVRTAMRATDILMDRVWQLEIDRFHDVPGFVFAPITAVVQPAADPTALHVELQHQLPNIRTDLDRFSPLEISSLIRHGYCVGRQVCRAHPELFGADLPAGRPWDPIPAPAAPTLAAPTTAAPTTVAPAKPPSPIRTAARATLEARALLASAHRRIWSTLLDYRDWTSYIYVPLVVPILVLLPYFISSYLEHTHRVNQIMQALSQGSRDLELMTRLLENGPDRRPKGEVGEEVSSLDKSDMDGFEVLQDSFALDLRDWRADSAGASDPNSQVHHYRRLKVVRKASSTDAGGLVHWRMLTTDPAADIKFPHQQVQPRLRKCVNPAPLSAEGQPAVWEVAYDLRRVPPGEPVDLFIEFHASGKFLTREDNRTTLRFITLADTAELTQWILMPARHQYQNFQITRSPVDSPEKIEPVRVVTEYLANDYTILAYKLLALKGGYKYEVSWVYR
jgi:predicted acylesterase/phospholipase RssA